LGGQRPDNGRPQSRGGGLANASLALGLLCLLQLPVIFGGGLKVRLHPSLLPVGAYSLFACLPLGLVGVILGVVALTVRRPAARPVMWRARLGVAASAFVLLLVCLLFLWLLFGGKVCGSC
jgi:hypothetical protein